MKQKQQKRQYTASYEEIPHNTKQTLRRLAGYTAGQRGKLCIVALSALLSSASYAAIPLFVGKGIDQLIAAIQNAPDQRQAVISAGQSILLPVIFVAAAAAISSLLAYLQQYLIASAGETMVLKLRKSMIEKISRLPLQYFDTHKTGDIMSRVTNDLEKVSVVMQVGFMQFISSCFTVLFTTAVMLALNPALFAIVLVTVGACAVATKFVARMSQRYYAENAAAMGALGSKVEELYTGNRLVKILNQQQNAVASVEQLNGQQFSANRKAQFADFAIYPSIRFLSLVGFVIIAMTGSAMAFAGTITIGGIQAFLQYFNQLSEPVTQASYVITSLQSAIAGAERVFSLLDEVEEVPAGEQAAVPVCDKCVQFKNVQFGYTADNILIKNFNLTVCANETVAIVGPTGAGKTTIVNLLMRFYELNGGSILIDGVPITELPRQTLRRQIGMVLQDTWLFKGTIAENLAYGKQDASREEIIAAAKAACCDHFIRTLPMGYDTVISGESTSLSQGQMQLLTIARAMLSDPSIMILDEATSSVDTRTEAMIQKAMERLMTGRTCFVIAHRLSTIQTADKILVLKDGAVVEQGSHHALLAEKGFYASLYQSQFEQG